MFHLLILSIAGIMKHQIMERLRDYSKPLQDDLRYHGNQNVISVHEYLLEQYKSMQRTSDYFKSLTRNTFSQKSTTKNFLYEMEHKRIDWPNKTVTSLGAGNGSQRGHSLVTD
jgi:hypothetical protein